MKTAISLPDQLYDRATREARRRGVSRSKLVAAALEKYLEPEGPDPVTEAWNRMADLGLTEADPAFEAIQLDMLMGEPR